MKILQNVNDQTCAAAMLPATTPKEVTSAGVSKDFTVTLIRSAKILMNVWNRMHVALALLVRTRREATFVAADKDIQATPESHVKTWMNVRLLHVVPMHCVRIIQEISLVHVKKVSLETLIVAVSTSTSVLNLIDVV